MSIETDDVKMEELLLKNGFNKKNIAVMKKSIIQGGDPDETLFKLTLELKNRFFKGCFMIAVLFIILVYHVIAESNAAIMAVSIAIAFALIAIYYITPLNLGYKSFLLIKSGKISLK